jgi:hypothetical protein
MLKKRSFLFRVIVLGLLIVSCIGFQTVKASPMVMVDQPWWRTTGINQPVEFTANATGGTPPYTFQWYTTFLDPSVPSGQWHTLTVPDSNSSTFKFAASIPGRYGISIRLSDSKGDGEYKSFPPVGIVVTVQTSPVPQLTPSPSPTPTPSPPNFEPTSPPTPSPSQQPTINTGAEPPQTEPFLTTLAVASIVSIAIIGVGLLVYFKKRESSLVKKV